MMSRFFMLRAILYNNKNCHYGIVDSENLISTYDILRGKECLLPFQSPYPDYLDLGT